MIRASNDSNFRVIDVSSKGKQAPMVTTYIDASNQCSTKSRSHRASSSDSQRELAEISVGGVFDRSP